MATKDYASGSDRGGGKTAMEELEYLIANKPMNDQSTYLYIRNPDAWRKRVADLMEEKPTKTPLLNRLNQAFSLPSAWRTGAEKVSLRVDEINSLPFEIKFKIINSPDEEPSWDIVIKYPNGYTKKIELKYEKHDGYVDYDGMWKIFKCILKNWRERNQ